MYLQESVFIRRCTKICLFSAAQSDDKEMGRGRCIDDRSHHLLLGRLSPLWIPDEDAEECMMCRYAPYFVLYGNLYKIANVEGKYESWFQGNFPFL